MQSCRENSFRLLDLASGTGELEIRLVRLFPKIQLFALDSSPEMLSQARKKLEGSEQVTLVQSDLTRPLPFEDAAFDWVIFANGLHYVAQPGNLLQEIRRVIKPGGKLIIEDYTVHGPFLWPLFEKLIKQFDTQHYRTYTLGELNEFVKTAGFNIVDGSVFKIDWWWRGMIVKTSRPL